MQNQQWWGGNDFDDRLARPLHTIPGETSPSALTLQLGAHHTTCGRLRTIHSVPHAPRSCATRCVRSELKSPVRRAW